MPLYEYECKSCGTRFEKIQPVTAPPVKECIECHSPVRQIFHPVGVIFKGSGWYKTDSRKPQSDSSSDSKSDKSDKGDKDDKGDKGDKSDSKADAAPAKSDSSSSDSTTKTAAPAD